MMIIAVTEKGRSNEEEGLHTYHRSDIALAPCHSRNAWVFCGEHSG